MNEVIFQSVNVEGLKAVAKVFLEVGIAFAYKTNGAPLNLHYIVVEGERSQEALDLTDGMGDVVAIF